MPRPANPFAGLPREVGVLSAVAFCVAVGFGVVAPALPLFARDFGVSRQAAGAVIGVFALMRLVSAFGAGKLVDRIGERRLLATGMVIVAASSAVAGLAQSYQQLLVARGAGGIGSAMFSVSAASLLFRSVDNSQRGRATSLFGSGFLLGGISGPAIGGLLIQVSLRAPFFLYALTLLAAGTVGLLALPRHVRGEKADRPAAKTGLAAALRLPAYRAALAGSFGHTWAAFGVRATLIPLFVVEVLGESPVWIGVGFVIVAGVDALFLIPAGRAADSRGRRPVLMTGVTLVAAGMVALAVVPNLGGYLVAMVFIGAGSGLVQVAPAAIVGDVAQGRSGTTIAVYQMAGDLGTIGGALVSGRLADTVGFGAAFWLTATILAVAGVLTYLSPETRRAAEPVVEPEAPVAR